MDILRIICTITTIIIALIFLTLITSNKTCRTVPMMLVRNTYLAELVCACTSLGIALFTLTNDIKQIQHQDSLCIFRGYLINSTTVIQNHSFNLQALYRYVTVVHPSRRFWQSYRFQFCLVISTWIFGLVVFIPFLFTGDIIYNVENQICFMPLRSSFAMIYAALIVYMIPNMILNIIYFKLVRYVREMNKRVTPANVLTRAERELKMVRNIVSITTILVILGLPFSILFFMSFFTSIPKYHFRIAFIFIDVSTTAVIIALFKSTDPVKTAMRQAIDGLTNMLSPTIQ